MDREFNTGLLQCFRQDYNRTSHLNMTLAVEQDIKHQGNQPTLEFYLPDLVFDGHKEKWSTIKRVFHGVYDKVELH